jgi:hypothetical protein
MSSVVEPRPGVTPVDLPLILRASVKLAVIQTVFIVAIGLVSRFLEGPVEWVPLAVLLAAAAVITSFLPGRWVDARELDGIASAAGIGLTATGIFLLIDVIFLQGNLLPFGLYTHRWREIGGGSNWWYHPIWWMVGTYMPWLGAWILANQASRRGAASLGGAAILTLGLTLILGAVAAVVHFPGASFNVPTFGLAFLPALALATVVTGLGARRK